MKIDSVLTKIRACILPCAKLTQIHCTTPTSDNSTVHSMNFMILNFAEPVAVLLVISVPILKLYFAESTHSIFRKPLVPPTRGPYHPRSRQPSSRNRRGRRQWTQHQPSSGHRDGSELHSRAGSVHSSQHHSWSPDRSQASETDIPQPWEVHELDDYSARGSQSQSPSGGQWTRPPGAGTDAGHDISECFNVVMQHLRWL